MPPSTSSNKSPYGTLPSTPTATDNLLKEARGTGSKPIFSVWRGQTRRVSVSNRAGERGDTSFLPTQKPFAKIAMPRQATAVVRRQPEKPQPEKPVTALFPPSRTYVRPAHTFALPGSRALAKTKRRRDTPRFGKGGTPGGSRPGQTLALARSVDHRQDRDPSTFFFFFRRHGKNTGK